MPVSLLISKDEVKIRIQSHEFSALWLVLKELVTRLVALFDNKGTDDDLEITFPDAIPLNELFLAMEEHHSIRREIVKEKKMLEDRSYQFRVI